MLSKQKIVLTRHFKKVEIYFVVICITFDISFKQDIYIYIVYIAWTKLDYM